MERVGEFGARMVLVPMLLFLAACNIPALPDAGSIYIDRWAEIKGSDKDVSGILATFNRAEEALHARDLEGLMALYSEQYRYHGLSKSDLRRIWEEMFTRYDNLASTHMFSRIHVGGSAKEPTVEITSTGSLSQARSSCWGARRSDKYMRRTILSFSGTRMRWELPSNYCRPTRREHR